MEYAYNKETHYMGSTTATNVNERLNSYYYINYSDEQRSARKEKVGEESERDLEENGRAPPQNLIVTETSNLIDQDEKN